MARNPTSEKDKETSQTKKDVKKSDKETSLERQWLRDVTKPTYKDIEKSIRGAKTESLRSFKSRTGW